ncbi:MAG: hypothetical protein ACKOZX_05205, partial [Gammaproteobacteria bacterium]
HGEARRQTIRAIVALQPRHLTHNKHTFFVCYVFQHIRTKTGRHTRRQRVLVCFFPMKVFPIRCKCVCYRLLEIRRWAGVVFGL